MPSRRHRSAGFSTGRRVCSLMMWKTSAMGRPAASALLVPAGQLNGDGVEQGDAGTSGVHDVAMTPSPIPISTTRSALPLPPRTSSSGALPQGRRSRAARLDRRPDPRNSDPEQNDQGRQAEEGFQGAGAGLVVAHGQPPVLLLVHPVQRGADAVHLRLAAHQAVDVLGVAGPGRLAAAAADLLGQQVVGWRNPPGRPAPLTLACWVGLSAVRSWRRSRRPWTLAAAAVYGSRNGSWPVSRKPRTPVSASVIAARTASVSAMTWRVWAAAASWSMSRRRLRQRTAAVTSSAARTRPNPRVMALRTVASLHTAGGRTAGAPAQPSGRARRGRVAGPPGSAGCPISGAASGGWMNAV